MSTVPGLVLAESGWVEKDATARTCQEIGTDQVALSKAVIPVSVLDVVKQVDKACLALHAPTSPRPLPSAHG